MRLFCPTDPNPLRLSLSKPARNGSPARVLRQAQDERMLKMEERGNA